MTTPAFNIDGNKIGTRLDAVAGSYLHTVTSGTWQQCATCALPVQGYNHCPQCAKHLRADLPLADRTGYLVYADQPRSQTYRMMVGYKQPRTAAQFIPIIRALLAVGLSEHYRCAVEMAGAATTGWAVVPSTKEHHTLTKLTRSLTRSIPEVGVHPTETPTGRQLNPNAWRVEPDTALPDHVLVIDDSWVTGASAQSLAAALKLAGSSQVSILSIARVLSPDWPANVPFIDHTLQNLPYQWQICPWTGGKCPS